MPTYQYACTECGHQLEAVQTFTDDPLTVCPECDGRLRKQFGSVGIVFKGPGFYRTDSRNGANGNGKVDSKTETETKAETKSESKAESKTTPESKTETKPDSKSSDKASSAKAAAAS